ncbi:UDP-N-acetylglucosamine--N-acetylmuramyl-(pentapeptide) pyrophosphoryl-undecaprenol N-acetylglucosamine transferase [Actinospica sp. MGRD01-02]|uniref:UDP-N-acetylglucosamine--N-acetylmuramyl-(pentapeptide) pyrophosphoryl-undecaprenol N-acetylglucosamine transferase n=1 Tax=Actinospica acidithermotolerans TaxID=2828514 RepID=A0A941EHV1_9ACTN|nr:UDP-N-acetylglucosamine--N-acetylmuramyl-(pentapeptide) pyrophosphoryl-undecaprenol N-acetylglucosamine transferase [Actinospica acidithermotolerans]MBR7829389.1 UDP-N-acetylglucosamine--N-acetylmuramyl-(pentapeptide) pyrophosphoryl-undecaprenol N-acetylglucosamine transferase [Actinospica acidithermotolerans]
MSSRADGARPVRVIVTGGGTGGHVYPALTTVNALRAVLAEQGRALSVSWVGARGKLEERIAGEHGIEFLPVATGKLRRARNPLGMLTWTNIKDLARVPWGAVQACGIVRRLRPDVVVGFGGYVAVPVSVAAWLCRRPLVIHEQTVRLGLANRILARLAKVTAVSSESTLGLLPGGARAELVGNPIRAELFGGEPDRAVAALGLDGFDRALPTVYVTGGALGARQINNLIVESLPWLLKQANVVHQCGAAEIDRMREAATALSPELAPRYHVAEFIGAELPDLFALADLVVARSGAGTIAELSALGKPAVLIPLASSAGGEQSFNARYLDERGAARALLGEVTGEDLRAAIGALLDDPAARGKMAEHARELGKPDAARTLSALILRVAGA